MDDLAFSAGDDSQALPRADGRVRATEAIDHLLLAPPDPALVATVVVPVRNEADALPDLIGALARQRNTSGDRFSLERVEVILLFSHCTDGSPAIAARAARGWPGLRLHGVDLGSSSGGVTVGMARRLLMDAAARRLERVVAPDRGVVLTTDADTRVAPDWLVQNLLAIRAGADAVGGQVIMNPADRAALPAPLRRRYLLDHAYQLLVSRLEGLIDPDPDDPLPRHHQHAGASLAVTVRAYWRAGGMPPLANGEDEAFFLALKRTGARFRHSTAVRAFTSGRLEGRAELGLAGTLKRWGEPGDEALVTAPGTVLERLRRRARERARNEAEERHGGSARVRTIAPAQDVPREHERALVRLREVLAPIAAEPSHLVPLEDAVRDLGRLLASYEPSRFRRSSRQVA